MVFDSPEAEMAMMRQVDDLVRVYLQTAPKDEKPLAVEVAVESPLVDPFTGEDLGIPLVGVLDLVLDSDAGPIITDFKTAARSSEPMEISHEMCVTKLPGGPKLRRHRHLANIVAIGRSCSGCPTPRPPWRWFGPSGGRSL